MADITLSEARELCTSDELELVKASRGKPFWHAEAYAGPLWMQPQVIGKPRHEGRIPSPEDVRLYPVSVFHALSSFSLCPIPSDYGTSYDEVNSYLFVSACYPLAVWLRAKKSRSP
jgi:hypothetical protein